MDALTLKDGIIGMIKEELAKERPDIDIKGDTSLSGDISSLDKVIILGNIEDTYNVSFEDYELGSFATVDDLVACVEGKLK